MSDARSYEFRQFYIDGRWVDPKQPNPLAVVNPASERSIGTIEMGSAADVDDAVEAARRAFVEFSQTSRAERLSCLERLVEAYEARKDEIAQAISDEMGAPIGLARRAQAPAGPAHLASTIEVLRDYTFENDLGRTRILRQPIGVCALITPWNWPINQIVCKVAPALAAGCTMVLKPSEIAPLSAVLFAQVMDAAGVPAGVFNLVNGDGATVGQALSSHPAVDMVSFTGSTRAGAAVACAAAPTVKRVTQELGGKSANVILDDADLEQSVMQGTTAVFVNSGQSCDAATRMLVPAAMHDQAVAVAREVAEKTVVGDPAAKATRVGPVVSRTQFDRIQKMIQAGIDEGAVLVAGGLGRPEGLETGYYVRPTVFAGVDNSMSVAREEIFGPVLSILPYNDEQQAIRIANDSPYGLSARVQSTDLARARGVAARLRAGQVHLNQASYDFAVPFGGFRQSGNGREWGVFGLEEYLEIQAILGYSE